MTCGLDHSTQEDRNRYYAELTERFDSATREVWEASSSMRTLLNVVDQTLSVIDPDDSDTDTDVRYLFNLQTEVHTLATRLSRAFANLDARYQYLTTIPKAVRP